MIVYYPGVAPCPQYACTWLHNPIGRDRGLKNLPVWVRIPLELPGILLIPYIFTDKAERRLAARTDSRNGLTECGHSPGYRPKEAQVQFLLNPTFTLGSSAIGRARVSKILGCGIVPHLPRHRREQQHLFKYELDCKSETHKQDAPSLFMERQCTVHGRLNLVKSGFNSHAILLKMGRWRTGLAHRTENPRTSVRLGPDPPAPK